VRRKNEHASTPRLQHSQAHSKRVRRSVGRLTARQVANAKPPPGKRKLLLPDGGNLFLQATRNKRTGLMSRSWLFRYERDGVRHEMGLGPVHTRSLAEARDEAKRLRLLRLDGTDPLEHRDRANEARAVEAAKNKTLGQVAAAYLKAHRQDWKNPKHAAQWETSLTKDVKAIANLPVAKIDTAHILQVLEPIWREKPESASRTRGRIERVLAYAMAAKYRKKEDGNPARWDGHLQELLGSKAAAQKAKRQRSGTSGHHPALPYKELPEFMAELRQLDSLSARALEFTILTAARTSEVIGAKRSEFGDLKERVWAVPADRMKMGKEHRVPLSDRAVEILHGLKHQGTSVFPLSNMGMLECLRGLRPGLTVHGFRSCFMDWCHEQTAFPKVVIDMALAHAIGDKVEAAYRRGDLFEKRRKLMAQWAEYCAKPPVIGAAAIPIRERAHAS
jgi:integrase